jgi:hypothetical protein
MPTTLFCMIESFPCLYDVMELHKKLVLKIIKMTMSKGGQLEDGLQPKSGHLKLK